MYKYNYYRLCGSQQKQVRLTNENLLKALKGMTMTNLKYLKSDMLLFLDRYPFTKNVTHFDMIIKIE